MAAAEDVDCRRAILLRLCRNTTYAPMKDLVSPNKPKDKADDELVEIVAKHDKAKPGKSCPVHVLHSLEEGWSVGV